MSGHSHSNTISTSGGPNVNISSANTTQPKLHKKLETVVAKETNHRRGGVQVNQ